MENFTVYAHINNKNRKAYIGITSQKPSDRWGHKGNGYKGQMFFNAIQKYGWNNFEHKIIAKNLTETAAKKMETELIIKYKTTDDSWGYNMTFGGECEFPSETTKAKMSIAQKNRTISDEAKLRISKAVSEANKSRVISDETREKMRISSLGKYHTEDSKRKMSELKKGYKRTEESKRKQSINHADMSGKNNPMYGKKFTEEHRTKISESLKGRTLSDEHKEKLKGRTGELSAKSRKVVQMSMKDEFLNEYINITEAAKQTGAVRQHISKCCNGKRKKTGGYKWMYLEDYEQLNNKQLSIS